MSEMAQECFLESSTETESRSVWPCTGICDRAGLLGHFCDIFMTFLENFCDILGGIFVIF